MNFFHDNFYFHNYALYLLYLLYLFFFIFFIFIIFLASLWRHSIFIEYLCGYITFEKFYHYTMNSYEYCRERKKTLEKFLMAHYENKIKYPWPEKEHM